ncbi:MAG TPA: hypothetical protein VJI73_00900 [Candidatus Paceibacterota bacterium]
MDYLISFLDSNFFIALTTSFVGSLAIYLYYRQKREYKRDAALLILQEIRYAEQQIRGSRAYSQNAENYPLSSKLLPTNSWYKNIHLFMGDFEQSQVDCISRFYSQVEYVDRVIEGISNYKTSIIEEEIVNEQTGLIMVAEEILPDRVYLREISRSLSRYLQRYVQPQEIEPNITSPHIISSLGSTQSQTQIRLQIQRKLKSNSILKEVSNKVEFVYDTAVGEKLREISKGTQARK